MGGWYAFVETIIFSSYALAIYHEIFEKGWRPNNNQQAVVLGDSAYPLKSWLITPNIPGFTGRGRGGRRPLTEAMEEFLRRFRKTRMIVERSIGILKCEFPVLKYCFRIRRAQKVAAITLACIALHNLQNEYVHGEYDDIFFDDIDQGKHFQVSDS